MNTTHRQLPPTARVLASTAGAALGLSLLATVYPALRAAAIQPARAVHFD